MLFLGFLVAPNAFAAFPEGGTGALAATGEPLEDAAGSVVVVGVEVHPEYERYALRLDDGRVAVAELTTGAGGLCDVGGLTIFPRADLSGVNQTTGMSALCERLAARRPSLRARAGAEKAAPGSDGGVSVARSPGLAELGGPMGWTPIHLALGLLAVLALPRLRLDRMLLGVTAASLLVRVWAAPRGITNGALAGYEKLLLARGGVLEAPYGQGWGAIMGLFPGWPDSVFLVDFGFAVVAAPLLAAIVRREAGAFAGLAAGLLFACLPTHVAVSASETMHVPPLTLELLAVLAAGSFARGGGVGVGLVAALASGIAVHIRPDALSFLVVPVLWALAGSTGAEAASERTLGARIVRLGLPALTLAGLVGLRLASLGDAPSELLVPPGPEVLLPRLGPPLASRSFQLFWHAGLTPPVVWGLALVGTGVLLRGRRLALLGLLLLWAIVTTVPFAAKVFPLVDAVRLQLAGQAPWIALAAIGVAALPRWALPGALLTFLPYLPVRPWVQTQEWQFLRENVPEIPADWRVRYDGRPQRSEAFAAVMQAIGPARWTDGPLPEGGLRYVGLDCRASGGCDTSGCVEWRVTRLDGRVDLDLSLEERTIGFWRCPGTAPTADGAISPPR